MTSIFMCMPAGGVSWPALAAWLLILAFIFFKFKIGKALAEFNGIAIPDSAHVFERVIPDPEYLQSALHLSEKMMADLTSGIQALERKSLAVITGGAALSIFLAAGDWCPEPSNTLKILSIAFSIAAVLIAGLVISATEIGLSGAPPSLPAGFWHKLQQTLPAETRRANAEKNYMYMVILTRYQQAVESSYKVASVKIRRFAVAAYCLFAGYAAFIGWMTVKLLPVVTG